MSYLLPAKLLTSGTRRWLRAPARVRDGLGLALLALLARALVAIWAAPRFPPADDGTFYHTVALRIADGQGYTWLWPDGVITYAAHYPIGYPALVGLSYAVFGKELVVPMLCNALVGAAGVFAVHDLASRIGSRLGAVLAGAVVAFHPSLLGYTPAFMTEAITSSLVALAAALACRLSTARRVGVWAWLALGVLSGALVLFRPQLVLFVPVLGLVAGAALGARSRRGRAAGALIVTGLAVACCLPWTVRNCVRMDRCAFVSANGGWNLLIGALPGSGSFVPIEGATVPPACREVFAEVEKDRCFGRAGLDSIRSAPLVWLAKIPAKLAATFDYVGAAAHYLHASNPGLFESHHKLALGVLETVWHRGTVLVALVALARAEGPRRRSRIVTSALAIPWLFVRSAWLAHLGLIVSGLLLGARLLRSGPVFLALSLLGLTALTHAIFFGAGRYSLVVMPLVSALIACQKGALGGPEARARVDRLREVGL
jgi:4-amino-4-deoxy-L-arabinose transferase-like glycosyltransferase